ncbi:DUF7527 domain-containing protein [Natronococcus occultus]|uniref:DUF7527 domain-containing protein n=1 Tax=Natronococcus occultus SP4 TaxID=694430 RepID=L0JXQ1_9EURY|nr:hypothetical protein [Natronococcus occultus]AGB36879.1 hypothetical protein Natoc_1034 [Natronococcus occultus SP4]
MDSRTQERVERWDARPFDGDLRALAGADFSGAVADDGSWLFLLGGRIVGVVDGAPAEFAGGSGTVYEAPHRALPLLCSMETQRDTPRGTYYTNETPLEEVDRTLQEGSFTGFVELSENVHSGDYYLVYYGGRRMAIAYVGNAERLLVGTEAFERAADEVGIYEVVDVDIEVTDVDELALAGRDAEPATRTDGDLEHAASAETARATASSASVESSSDTAEATSGVDRSDDGDEPESTIQDEPASRDEADDATAESTQSSGTTEPEPDADRAPENASGPAAVASEDEDRTNELETLRTRNQELSATVDRLRSRVRTLESELESARAGTERSAPGPDLDLDEALSQTNLFVRYDSRSQPTLDTAHESHVDRAEVDANLRLEYHTQFDDVGATVDGDPFEDVLAETMAFRFLEWLTTELFFEIRDTGRADALGELYEGISRIDRVELDSSIPIEDGDREAVAFDVVAYDKMGNPLLVATLNDSREPIPRDVLEGVATDAAAVARRHSELAAALVVTRSYFEPGALEVVEEATKSGFLSRGSRLSYVNSPGYHLCLAELRSAGFHVTVPEL